MNFNCCFSKKSYELHEAHFNNHLIDEEKKRHSLTWLQEDTVDAWRHERMRASLLPLLSHFQGAHWLTVGDGRYGTDAHFIQKHGSDAIATDISDALLSKAMEYGFIRDFKKENAESLSFADGEFDFCLCKESYHHFPRPAIALYEMLRVVEKGVVLIEPNDIFFSMTSKVRGFLKSLLGKKHLPHRFEEVGNYVYAISEREVEKIALAMGLNVVAFKGLNDFYTQGVEYEKAEPASRLFKKVKARIFLANLQCKFKLNLYGILVSIIFKELPDATLRNSFEKAGFKIVDLPQNPHARNFDEDCISDQAAR